MPTPSVLQRITFDEELENANIGRIRAEQRRYLECHHRKGPILDLLMSWNRLAYLKCLF